MKRLLLLIFSLLFFSSFLKAQFTVNPSFDNTGQNSYNSSSNLLRVDGSIYGSSLYLTVRKNDYTAFTSSGIMRLLIPDINGTFNIYDTDYVSQGDNISYISVNLATSLNDCNFPLQAYAYYEATSSGSQGWAWVGPIGVQKKPTAPTISNNPSSATVNSIVTVPVTKGYDPAGGQVKIHVTADNSNRSNNNPYISNYSSGGVTENAGIVFYSSGIKNIYSTTFDVCGNPSSVVSRTINVQNAPPSYSDGNDNPAQAVNLSINSSRYSIAGNQYDQDWYKVYIPQHGTMTISLDVGTKDLQFRVFNSSITSSSNPNSSTNSIQPSYYDADGNPGNNNGTGGDEFYENIDVSPGYYYIKVAQQTTPTTNAGYRIYCDFLADPTLVSPINYATNVNTSPLLDWNTIASAQQYRVELANLNSSFNSPVISTNVGANTAYQITNPLNNNTDYKWRVRAWKSTVLNPSKGVQTPWSYNNYWRFRTSNNPCVYNDVASNAWYAQATTCLCQNGWIDDSPTASGSANPTQSINRAELAKIAALAANIPLNIAAEFPVPFHDLKEINASTTQWYYKYVAALSYLQYRNDNTERTPFDRDRFNFNPANAISRAHALKVLMETWNIPVQTGLPQYFTDVPPSHEMYHYIHTAKQLGIVGGAGGNSTTFNPNSNAIRADVFQMVYNITCDNTPIATPSVNTNVGNSDFYYPPNHHYANFNSALGASDGVFDHYNKTSFAISDVGLPLIFEHFYDSYRTEMPEEFRALDPMGKGWSHTYNAYIKRVNGNAQVNNAFLVVWPNGSSYAYEFSSPYVLTPITKGIKDDLVSVSTLKMRLTTKDKTEYVFERPGSNINIYDTYYLKSITDKNGNTLSIDYQNSAFGGGKKRIYKVTGSTGRTLKFYYHSGNDKLKEVRDPLNRSIKFYYNANGQLSQFTDAKNQSTKYDYVGGSGYYSKYYLRRIKLPKGNSVYAYYDNQRKIKQVKLGNGHEVSYDFKPDYGSNFNFKNDIISSGVTSSLQMDGMGNTVKITTPSGVIDSWFNNNTHPYSPTKIRGIDNLVSEYTYYTDGNIKEVRIPSANISHKYYYNNDNLTKYIDPKGGTYQFTYDNNSNLVAAASPRGTTTYSRQANGLLNSVTNPSGITASYSYDTYGNNTGVNMPMGISSSTTYDIVGRPTSATNADNKTSYFQYDANDNITKVTNALGNSVEYTYDANENLKKIKNESGYTTTNLYQYHTDYLYRTSFAGKHDNYEYYPDGRIKKFTDPSGTVYSYQYDNKNRLEKVTQGGTLLQQLNYNQDNTINKVFDSNGQINFLYDNLNRIIRVTNVHNRSIRYAYDKNNNVTQITYPDGKKVNYTYYADNLMHTVTDWNGQTTSYTYHADGRLQQVNNGNGTIASYTYDAAGRMTGIENKKSDGTIINSQSFALDPVGRHTSENTSGQLPYPGTIAATTNLNYNPSNEIINASYGFDNDGNADYAAGVNYTFNNEDELSYMGGGGMPNTNYEYDCLGHRVKRTESGSVTKYVNDILGMSKVLMETYNSGTAKNYYVWGLGLISRVKPNGTTHYYHYDYRGSTLAMTDYSQNVTHEYLYSDFGEILNIVEADDNAFCYVGKYGVMTEGNDHYFMRARYYDAGIGRFLSEDPVWHTNLYPYADNDPVNMIDPLGLDTEVPRLLNTEQATEVLNNIFIAGRPLKESEMNEDLRQFADCVIYTAVDAQEGVDKMYNIYIKSLSAGVGDNPFKLSSLSFEFSKRWFFGMFEDKESIKISLLVKNTIGGYSHFKSKYYMLRNKNLVGFNEYDFDSECHGFKYEE